MQAAWCVLILLVSVLQGNVYLMRVDLFIRLSNTGTKGCSLKMSLKLLSVEKGKHTNTCFKTTSVTAIIILREKGSNNECIFSVISKQTNHFNLEYQLTP